MDKSKKPVIVQQDSAYR